MENNKALLSAEKLDKLKAKAERGEYITRFEQLGIIAQARLAAQPVVAPTNDLPQLPAKAGTACDDGYWVIGKDGPLAALPYGASVRCEFFTADQMRDYARVALAAPVVRVDSCELDAPAANAKVKRLLAEVTELRFAIAAQAQPAAAPVAAQADTNEPSAGELTELMTYPSPHGTLVRLADVKCWVMKTTRTPTTSAGEADTTASVSGESVSKAELWDAIHQYVSDYGDQFRMPPTTGAGKRCNASRDELAAVIDRLYAAPVAAAAPADPLREAVKTITQFVNDGEWADLLHTDPDVVALWDAVDRLLAKNGAAPVSQAVEQPADDAEDAQTQAARDVLAERRRQVEAEGWTPAHDDGYTDGELARAAAAYTLNTVTEDGPHYWPWPRFWWKPISGRRDLVKAGALLLAEIERIDRAAMSATKQEGDK